MSQVIYKTSNTEELLKLNPSELKVLLAFVGICKNNVVDMQRKEPKVIELTGINARSLANNISKLKKRGVITALPGVRRAWFIDPSYFVCGYYQKVYNIAKMIENKDKYILANMDEMEEEERAEKEESVLQDRWEKKREEQRDFDRQIGIVDGMTDNYTVGGDVL